MKKYFVLIQCLLFLTFSGFSQDSSLKIIPEIGKFSPVFTMYDISYYGKEKVSLSDMQGKYVILDFWTPGCTACIDTFKKIELIKESFGDKVEFFAIGIDRLGKNGTDIAKRTFQKYRKRWNLSFPSAYDSALFKMFDVKAVPYSVWIDDKGVIRAFTLSTDINAENLNALLAGKTIKSRYRLKGGVPIAEKFNYHKPLLINGNGGSDSSFLFRSVLAQWNPNTAGYWQPFITSVNTIWSGVEKNRVQLNGVSLSQLIEISYGDTISHLPPSYYGYEEKIEKMMELSSYENYWIKPVLELKDTSDFVYSWETGENVYSYSLIVPEKRATAAYMRNVMQRDLLSYFGYDISIDVRSMPCWYLTASKEVKSKLKTAGNRTQMDYNPSGIKLANIPFHQLIRFICAYNMSLPPIINNTGISEKIDFELDVAMMDFDDLMLALREKGLFLKKGKKEMKVIVVRNGKRS